MGPGPNHAADTGADVRSYRSYFDYDAFHRLGRQSAPKSTRHERGLLIWTAAEYDPNDNLVAQYDPAYGAQYTPGPVTTTVFDAMGRPTLVTGPDTSADPAGERTAIEYDQAGRTTRVTAPKGVATTDVADDFTTVYTYDPLDRVVRTAQPRVDDTGAVVETLYTHGCFNLAGDLVRVTAPNAGLAGVDCTADPSLSHTTTYAYDAAHRLTTVTDPEGHTRTVDYDANGNAIATTDAAGTTTETVFDQRNLAVQVREPFTATRDVVTRVEYDPVGNTRRVISPRAGDASADKATFTQYVTSYVYDEVNRLIRVDLPSTGPGDAAYVHRGYDANGNLTLTTLPTTAADPANAADEDKTVVDYFACAGSSSSGKKNVSYQRHVIIGFSKAGKS